MNHLCGVELCYLVLTPGGREFDSHLCQRKKTIFLCTKAYFWMYITYVIVSSMHNTD